VDFDVIESITDQMFHISQIMDRKWEYNGTVHHLFVDFRKAHGSVKREALYNILTELHACIKL